MLFDKFFDAQSFEKKIFKANLHKKAELLGSRVFGASLATSLYKLSLYKTMEGLWEKSSRLEVSAFGLVFA